MTPDVPNDAKFFTPPEGFLVRGLDGIWRRGDNKPLSEYDLAVISGEKPWDYWARKRRERKAAADAADKSGDAKP